MPRVRLRPLLPPRAEVQSLVLLSRPGADGVRLAPRIGSRAGGRRSAGRLGRRSRRAPGPSLRLRCRRRGGVGAGGRPGPVDRAGRGPRRGCRHRGRPPTGRCGPRPCGHPGRRAGRRPRPHRRRGRASTSSRASASAATPSGGPAGRTGGPSPSWPPRVVAPPWPRGRRTADAVRLARDLTNTPSSTKSPQWLVQQARSVARREGLAIEVRDHRRLAAEGFGGLIAVGQGSTRPPRLVQLDYVPTGSSAARCPGAPARGPGRQGHHLRHRWALDQAGRGHDLDEDRHGRRRGGPRRDGCAALPGRARPRHRSAGPGREHAVGHGDAPQRRDHPLRRHDGRGPQHRRRGPAGAGRRPRLHGRSAAARRRGRPRDADRAR